MDKRLEDLEWEWETIGEHICHHEAGYEDAFEALETVRDRLQAAEERVRELERENERLRGAARELVGSLDDPFTLVGPASKQAAEKLRQALDSAGGRGWMRGWRSWRGRCELRPSASEKPCWCERNLPGGECPYCDDCNTARKALREET